MEILKVIHTHLLMVMVSKGSCNVKLGRIITAQWSLDRLSRVLSHNRIYFSWICGPRYYLPYRHCRSEKAFRVDKHVTGSQFPGGVASRMDERNYWRKSMLLCRCPDVTRFDVGRGGREFERDKTLGCVRGIQGHRMIIHNCDNRHHHKGNRGSSRGKRVIGLWVLVRELTSTRSQDSFYLSIFLFLFFSFLVDRGIDEGLLTKTKHETPLPRTQTCYSECSAS
jgi:hypothetical protein